MTERLFTGALVALIVFVCMALSIAPEATASDAGAVEAVEAPVATATPTPTTPAPVLPAAEPAEEPDVGGVIAAFRGGEYLVGLAGAIYLIVMLLGAVLKPKSKTTKRILAYGVAFAATGLLGWYAGAALTVSSVLVAAIAAWTASGMNEDAKDAVSSDT